MLGYSVDNPTGGEVRWQPGWFRRTARSYRCGGSQHPWAPEGSSCKMQTSCCSWYSIWSGCLRARDLRSANRFRLVQNIVRVRSTRSLLLWLLPLAAGVWQFSRLHRPCRNWHEHSNPYNEPVTLSGYRHNLRASLQESGRSAPLGEHFDAIGVTITNAPVHQRSLPALFGMCFGGRSLSGSDRCNPGVSHLVAMNVEKGRTTWHRSRCRWQVCTSEGSEPDGRHR